MNKYLSVFISILLMSLACLANAQEQVIEEESIAGISLGDNRVFLISGFGDFLANFHKDNDGETFGIGQAEVGLESELTECFSAALAIAYDGESFAIGTFTVEYILWNAGKMSPEVAGVNKIVLGGGQFDVPFGIDYHVYPSIDRKLISSPLVVESTHDSWNDYGGYATAEASWGSLTAFIANGFSHEGTDPEGEDIETHNDLAIGGRLGVSPHESVEIGSSLAGVSSLDSTHDMLLAGVDFHLSFHNFEFKGEYISHKFDSDVENGFTNDGYYFQGLYGFNNWYLAGRYDEFRPDKKSGDNSQTSTGIGYIIDDIVNLRLEYQIHESAYNAAIFQIAFGF